MTIEEEAAIHGTGKRQDLLDMLDQLGAHLSVMSRGDVSPSGAPIQRLWIAGIPMEITHTNGLVCILRGVDMVLGIDHEKIELAKHTDKTDKQLARMRVNRRMRVLDKIEARGVSGKELSRVRAHDIVASMVAEVNAKVEAEREWIRGQYADAETD